MNPLQRAALALEAANSRLAGTTTESTAPEPLVQVSNRVARRRIAADSSKQHLIPPADPEPVIERAKARAPARIKVLPSSLGRKHTGLPTDQHALLLAKRDKLRALNARASAEHSALANAIDATLLFAQESAGTAVCITSSGLLLTCAHCLSEDPHGPAADDTHMLIFSSGQIVQTKCIAFDAKRDLALLQILAAQPSVADAQLSSAPALPAEANFPATSLSSTRPKARLLLACIGHPGSEDLENPLGGATDYPVLSVSTGRYRGLAPGQDVQDNSAIGALQHDCWTYWGHSGAPLVDEKTGELVGLHSSWDEASGMRRGVAWEAIGGFLKARMRDGGEVVAAS